MAPIKYFKDEAEPPQQPPRPAGRRLHPLPSRARSGEEPNLTVVDICCFTFRRVFVKSLIKKLSRQTVSTSSFVPKCFVLPYNRSFYVLSAFRPLNRTLFCGDLTTTTCVLCALACIPVWWNRNFVCFGQSRNFPMWFLLFDTCTLF